MNTNEEIDITSKELETNTIENKQDIISQVVNNSDQLENLYDSVEIGVGEILWSDAEIKTLEEKYTESLDQLKKLQDQIKTLTSVAATSQSQYLSLKSEFDSAQRMRSLEKARDKISAIIAVAKKFTILLQDMKNFIIHLTPELEENNLVKWFILSYKNFIEKTLVELNIKQIESLGLTPDSELHEVVMIDTATELDTTILNGLGHEWSDFASRIIREFEVGYYYMDGETRHIIKAAKVVVGQ